MATKRRSALADAMAAEDDNTGGAADAAPGGVGDISPLDHRIETSNQITQTVRWRTLKVDPSECVVWEHNPRAYHRLNERNCKDLIDRFLAHNEQLVAAIVRPIRGSTGPAKYEIISGSRRFWTVNWIREHHDPEFPFLIQIRTLSDEEAFMFSDTENTARTDVSPYERALDYKTAIDTYYDGSLAKLHAALQGRDDESAKDKATISKYLKMATLPVEIADAYAEWSDFALIHSIPYAKYMEDPKSRKKLLKAAAALREEHKMRRDGALDDMTGVAVFKRLKAAVADKPKSSGGSRSVKSFGPPGKPHLILSSKNKRHMKVTIPLGSGASADDLRKAFETCIEGDFE